MGNFFSMSTKTVVSKVVYEVFAGIIGWFAAKAMDWLFDLIPKDMEFSFWQWLIYPQFSALNILIFIVVVGFLSWLIWRRKNTKKRILNRLNRNTFMQITDAGTNMKFNVTWTVAEPVWTNMDYHCLNMKVECLEHHTTLSDSGYCPDPQCPFHRNPFNIRYMENLINTEIRNKAQKYLKSK